jgi:hypothetical protein
LCDAEIWTLGKVDQKYLYTSEIWCWMKLEKISWADRVKNVELLREVEVENNVLHTIKERKANWIGHISRGNCLLRIIEGKKDGRS